MNNEILKDSELNEEDLEQTNGGAIMMKVHISTSGPSSLQTCSQCKRRNNTVKKVGGHYLCQNCASKQRKAVMSISSKARLI